MTYTLTITSVRRLYEPPPIMPQTLSKLFENKNTNPSGVEGSEDEDDEVEEVQAIEVASVMNEEDDCSEYQLPKHYHLCVPSSEPYLNSRCLKSWFKWLLQESIPCSICKVLGILEQKRTIHTSSGSHWKRVQTLTNTPKWHQVELSLHGRGTHTEDCKRARRGFPESSVCSLQSSDVSHNLYLYLFIYFIWCPNLLILFVIYIVHYKN